MAVVAHSFQRCKGKSQLPNDLGIQYGLSKNQWEGKDGTSHAQLRVHAKTIDILNIGKKQDGANAAANAATDSNVPDVPTDTPKEKKDDLPF